MESNVLFNWLAIVVPATVTIIGLWISFRATRNNFIQEISKQKTNVYLNKLADAPNKLLQLVDSIQQTVKSGKDASKLTNQYQDVLREVFAYGTVDAIKIISAMQQNTYNISKESDIGNKDWVMPYIVLLICQLKYDMTDIGIRPDYWYKMSLVDYDDVETQEKYKSINNQIVIELGLCSMFKI